MATNMTPSRIARAWRDGGPWLVMKRAAGAVVRPVLATGRVEFFVKDLANADLHDHPVPGVTIEEASAGAAPFLLMDREESGTVAKEIRRRFDRGDRCVVARDAEGRYLHTRWVTTRPTEIPEIARFIAPRVGQAYMYDGYTREAARGRGIDGAVRNWIFRRLADEGIREVVSYVRGSNRPGLAAARKWQVAVGGAKYLRLAGRRTRTVADRALGARVDLLGMREARRREDELARRRQALREWFDSWLVEPADKRSTGCSALPPEYFESAGRHIVDTLGADPERDVVLDVGCSSGGISRHVAPHCRRFFGVDMTAGLVADIPLGSIVSASGEPAAFSAADGRALPFAAGTFDRVYCTGVIHVVPDRADAVKIVDELVRVCRPGGTVLVGAVPDAAKRRAELALVWRRAPLRGRLRLLAAMLVPKGLRRLLRRLLRRPEREVAFLKFDLRELARRYEARGIRTEIADYPADYWSEDFRTTRSNLLLFKPG